MRKRPWNRIDEQVYSLYTDKQKPNMNICTYVTPISLDPKGFIIGIYKGTYTNENIGLRVLLQYLSIDQIKYVKKLGYKHGPNKLKNLSLKEYKDLFYLDGVNSIVELEVISKKQAFDHDLLLCKVLSYKNLNNNTPLTTNILRENKIIS
jgi:flavin reductase (DIM6/NTAB) family NADH-FMN oxidoreductase RutF